MRAILQAMSLPSRSVKKNMETAEKQFKSKYPFSFRVHTSAFSPTRNFILHMQTGQTPIPFRLPLLILYNQRLVLMCFIPFF